MSDTPHRHRLSDAAGPFTDIPTLDPHPTASGRWQPTRAGAVNSWLWTDEQFAYAGGCLAMVGMNGSGKSLTSAVLCPTFIDGNVTAKNLSAAAEAAGTLTSIHTLGRPGPPKSGTWWQEYGRTDPDGPHARTRWLTAGLWLHSGGGQRNTLDRAWFLVPARVHAQLVLERDGMPVTITDLAAQLGALDGLLFTSSPRLEQQCRDHTSVLRREEDYPETVRERMYQPLDGTQTDALATVLRALRSVQAGDKISPRTMEETLTSALPALETRRVQSLADALSKAEQLQGHLQATRTEHGILSDVRAAYRRYVAAAATTTAVNYTTRHTLHAAALTARDEALNAEALAQERQSQATAALHEDEKRAEQLRATIRTLENRVAGHPGTSLGDLSRNAQDCEDRAADSLQHAEQAEAVHQDHQKQSAAARQTAHQALAAWAKTTHDLGRHAQDLGAAPFHEPLASALEEAQQHQGPADSDAAVAAREQAAAWGRAQSQAAERVQTALELLADEHDKHSAAQEDYEDKRRHAEAAETQAHNATDALEQTEETTRAALTRYSTRLKRLPALPDDLCNAIPLDADAIRAWVAGQAADTLTKLDVRACEERADARSQAADEAAARAAEASELAVGASQGAAAIADALSRQAGALADTPGSLHTLLQAVYNATRTTSPGPGSTRTGPGDTDEALLDTLEEAARDDLGRRGLLIRQAGRHLAEAAHTQQHATAAHARARQARTLADAAEAAVRQARSTADQEAHAWASRVHAWARDLKVLDPAGLRLPDSARPLDLNAAHRLTQDTAKAHRSAVETLSGRLAEAELRLSAEQECLEDLEEKICRARQGGSPPAPPRWRAPRHDRAGVPLWEAVEFAPHLQPDEADRLEGALHTAGLLDAWISPTGEMTAGDTTLILTPEHQGPSLADVLVPDSHAPVAPALIRRLLAGVRLLQPGERPLPGQAAVGTDGTAYLGPLAAASPAAWGACHIGAAARERARQQLLADLEENRRRAASAVAASRTLVGALKDDLAAADREQASPDPAPWRTAEDTAAATAAEAEAKSAAAHDTAQAATTAEGHRQSTSRIAERACEDARLPMSQQAVEAALTLCTELTGRTATTTVAAKSAIAANRTLHTANEHAARARAEAAQTHRALTSARQAAHETEQDRRNLPSELSLVPPAQEAASQAHQLARETANEATAAETMLGRHTSQLSAATSRLRSAAHNAFAGLPQEAEDLERYRSRLQALITSLSSWGDAALHAHFAAQTAAGSHSSEAAAKDQAERLRRRADDDQRAADQTRHRHREEVRQHERPYRQLSAELERRLREQSDLDSRLTERRAADQQARLDHSRKGDESRDRTGRLEAAGESRAAALSQLQALFDHGLVAELADSESLHRPEPEDALHIAQALLKQRGLGDTPALEQAAAAESEARTQLDRRIRHNLSRLIEINRHVVAEDIPGTPWRRITVTHLGHGGDTGTAQTRIQPLRAILDGLTRTITRLENDFSEQVQNGVKGVVFSELRRDINTRIDTARSIVEDITRTLDGVRTGVANVGIRLQWLPKNDAVARQALQLIQQADLAGDFDRMYDFFVEQLKNEEANYPTWAKRVEHVFNYRNWFTWEIALTHNDFRDDPVSDTEVFRTLTPRNNPLASLSGGEKRLVTMLPLLAAAHAFYSTKDYEGPHMVFIDELDAALDSNNLRKLLELLRTWDFDTVVTLPSMRPLLVAETQSIGIHRIHKTRTARYTIPSIWTGTGTPHTTRIRAGVPTPRPHEQPEPEGSA